MVINFVGLASLTRPFVTHAKKELDSEISENITHATFECTFVATIIAEITSTFFPNINSHFHLRDIILATITNKHPFYEGADGQQLASVIWDTFLCYVMKCRNAGKTPVAAICIHEIRSQLNRILKILPNCKISKHIKNHTRLEIIINQK